MEQIKKNYKDKMKELMPNQFTEEIKDKTLIERIEERMNKAKKEHSDNKDLSISQFWYGQWRAMEWILSEIKDDDNV
mgnify:CR=1 FL=1|jgi:hypothetical protein